MRGLRPGGAGALDLRRGSRAPRPGRLRLPSRPRLLSLSASEPAGWAALAVAGAISGWLNVVAGGGSFVTLSLMIFTGLPPTVANGSNRVAILAQNLWAVRRFHAHGAIDWSLGARAALPAVAGAALGTWLALAVGEEAFRRTLALLMVAMAVVTLFRPGTPAASGEVRPAGPWFGLGFFAVGLYGGFVQAGVGFLILAVTALAGLDPVRANALKMLVVLTFTPLALLLFVAGGRVEWGPGLATALGGVAGAELGVRFTLGRSPRTLRLVVNTTLVAFALRLWFR